MSKLNEKMILLKENKNKFVYLFEKGDLVVGDVKQFCLND
jgi:hypothetical protein